MRGFVFAVLAMLATPALAQTTGFGAPPAAPAPAPTTPPPTAAAPQGGGVAIPGQPLPDVERATFGDWQVICAGDTDFCAMKQFGLSPDGSPAAEVEIIKLPGDVPAVAGVTALLPLGVILEEGLLTRVDDNEPFRRAFQVCLPEGCIVRYGAEIEELNEMRAGTTLRFFVRAINVPQGPIPVTVSLRGFTAAFNSLEPQQVQ